jgi:hypothetical protein
MVDKNKNLKKPENLRWNYNTPVGTLHIAAELNMDKCYDLATTMDNYEYEIDLPIGKVNLSFITNEHIHK